MKKLFSVALVLLLLCGCSGANKTSDVELNVFLPGSYINEDVVTAFEEETGIAVNVNNNFDSNESMYAKLAGGTVYDILIPSDYYIEKLIQEDMIQPIDKDLIPNLEYLYDGVKGMSYDPEGEYSVPYFWGNVGIVYDTRKIDQADVEAEGWEVFHNTKYKGLIYVYDSERDEFMMALKQLGYSMNTTNEDELKQAFDWLRQITDTMNPAFVTDEAIDGLANPDANQSEAKYMGMMYSGDAAYILSENENAKFYVPTTGTNYFVDAMCIHSKTEHYEEACEFINYMLSYDASYDNSLEIGYSSCNKDVLKDLAAEEFAGNNAYLPSPRTALDEEFHNNDNVRKIIAEYWINVKTQN